MNRSLKLNKYTAEFKGLCPNDKSIRDKYKCKIYSKETIMVEDILSHLEGYKDKAVYQEDLVDKILKHLRCEKVILVGYHLGVKIKSISK